MPSGGLDANGNQIPLTSDGVPIIWVLSNNDQTLTGYKGDPGQGVVVMTITVNNQGNLTVVESQDFDHPDTTAEDYLTFEVPYSVADPVNPSVPGTIVIRVEDDSPELVPGEIEPLSATVLEDGLDGSDVTDDDLSTGNKESGEDNSDDETGSSVAGSLATLVSIGGDDQAGQPAEVSFSLNGANLNQLPTLYSAGDLVTYSVNPAGDTLTATADGRVVFVLTVQPNGDWTFNLNDQLDHVAGGGENFALITSLDGLTSVPSIDFDGVIVIKDSDGDAVNTGGITLISIQVQDDIPVRVADLNAEVVATVKEDGLSVGQNDGANGTGDLSEGNKESGETNADDEASGDAGSLTALFSVGADEPLKISLTTEQSVINALPNLSSKGEEVTYSVSVVNGVSTLTAVAGGNPDGQGGFTLVRTVFTLTVNEDGSWAFDLDDQLDHVVDGNTEGTTLVNYDGGSLSAIDFSSLIVATDFDNDAIGGLLNAGDFAITVEDDIPVRVADLNAEVVATVKEDGLSVGQNDGANGTGDLSEGNKESGETNADDEASGDAGSLTALFSVGADEPLKISLTTEQSVINALPNLSSKGEEVTYSVSVVNGVSTLTAVAGGNPDGQGGFTLVRTVFTLTVNEDGSWAFDLDDQLDHVVDGNTEGTTLVNYDGGSLSAIDFSSLIVATDFDNDAIGGLLNAGDFAITVEDDIPVRVADLNAEVVATVKEDGLSVGQNDGANGTGDLSEGNKESGETNADDEASGDAGSLTALFSVGADEPLKISLTTEQSVINALPNLSSKGEEVTYSVSVVNGVSTLTAVAGGNPDGQGGFTLVRTVFTLTVNEDGSWAFDLDDQLDHVVDGNTEGTTLVNYDGGSLSAIDFSSLIVATDFDNDAIGGLLNAGDFAITVEDDIPVRVADLNAEVVATVKEDGLSVGQNDGANGTGDLSEGNKESARPMPMTKPPAMPARSPRCSPSAPTNRSRSA